MVSISKRYTALVFVIAMSSTWARADDESVGQKAHDVGTTVVHAVEKGATVAGKAVEKGFNKVNEKVLKPADHWIQSKVNPKGTASASKPQGPVDNTP